MQLVVHDHLQAVDPNVMVQWLFVLRVFSTIVTLVDFVHHIYLFYRLLHEFCDIKKQQTHLLYNLMHGLVMNNVIDFANRNKRIFLSVDLIKPNLSYS